MHADLNLLVLNMEWKLLINMVHLKEVGSLLKEFAPAILGEDMDMIRYLNQKNIFI
jgi:hypothetical protein